MNTKQSVPMRERDAYRAAIETHFAPRERVRAAALAKAGVRQPAAARPRAIARPLARIAAVAAVLLLCTGAAFAAAEWIGRESYSPDRYLTDEQERLDSPIPDVENAIAAAAPAASGTSAIRLLPELEDAAVYAEWREKTGQPPFSEEDWGWLRELTPQIGEVLRDSQQLQWTTLLTTDHAALFEGGLLVDALPDSCYYTVEGSGELHELSCGGGIWSIAGDEMTFASNVQLDDTFPDSGLVTITQNLRFLDCKVDPQADIATVALLEYSFTFDAASGAAVSDVVHVSVPLSGTCCLTLETYDGPEPGSLLQNELVPLDGVVLDAAIDYRPTGIHVLLSIREAPDFWTDAHTRALLGPSYGDFCSGLSAAYAVNGETYKPEQTGSGPETSFVLPVFPSDYAQAQPLTMTLLADHVTAIDGVPLGETESRQVTAPWSTTGVSQELVTFSIPLP